MGFLAKVVLNLLRSLFLFNRLTEKNTDPCTKANIIRQFLLTSNEELPRGIIEKVLRGRLKTMFILSESFE